MWKSGDIMKRNEQPHVHVVGVAGVGMSALAQALHDAGYEVSGSDRYIDQGQDLDVLHRLRLAGIRLTPQDGSGLRADTMCIAVSTAIESDNIELKRAQELNIPVVHRAAMLARLAAGKRVVAVTGTAGKTTVTGLIGYLCAEAGLDPVVINGGAVINWIAPDRVGNVRKGESNVCILEADESDRSLLSFHPTFSVITNVSKDHFELDEVITLFRKFRDQTEQWTMLGPQAAMVLDGAAPESLAVERRADGNWFVHDGVTYPSPMPGLHNAENALLAVRVALALGIPGPVLVQALSKFRGIHRRLEVVARSEGITVLDDYAHNPAKIAASWRAAAEEANRVLGVWRPHGFGPLSLLFNELVEAFVSVCRPQDRVYILPVYYAGGTAKKSDDAERLANELAARGVRAEFVDGYDMLRPSLHAVMVSGDVVLGMGARDPELPVFLHALLTGRGA
jgi:UDP-N-acetylmuramate--alanine ligase